VLEYTGAFCQFYREDAHYLERTAPWIERVGLEKVKTAILGDAANRKALYERFLISQQPAQIDPWKARAEGAEANEFTPILIEA
jgi:nitrite reductase (NADH) large subunit